jgi:large subunit ribosomal protein L30
MIKITLKRGYIGIPDKQKKVLAALGLRKIGSSVERQENKAVQGMIRMVAHMVSVEKTGA